MPRTIAFIGIVLALALSGCSAEAAKAPVPEPAGKGSAAHELLSGAEFGAALATQDRVESDASADHAPWYSLDGETLRITGYLLPVPVREGSGESVFVMATPSRLAGARYWRELPLTVPDSIKAPRAETPDELIPTIVTVRLARDGAFVVQSVAATDSVPFGPLTRGDIGLLPTDAGALKDMPKGSVVWARRKTPAGRFELTGHAFDQAWDSRVTADARRTDSSTLGFATPDSLGPCGFLLIFRVQNPAGSLRDFGSPWADGPAPKPPVPGDMEKSSGSSPIDKWMTLQVQVRGSDFELAR